MNKRFFSVFYLVMLLFLVLAPLLYQPWLFLYGGGQRMLDMPSRPGMGVTIHFIHSVQKTPVWEYLAVNEHGNGFCLHATKYQSFGVGLPFSETDGTFHREGEFFIMDHMKRDFPQLHLRTGVGTKLTVTIDGTACPLYQALPAGSAVDVYTAPLYAWVLGKVR